MRKCVAVLTLLVAGAGVPVTPDDGNTDWSVYLGDSGLQHYSPLDQITPENVDQLAVAWTYDSGEPRGTTYTSPLVVDGVLYGLSPQLDAFALDAATGEELWRYEPEDVGGAQRGLMWWEGVYGARLFYTAGRELLAVNPTNGTPVEGFGE